MIRRFPLGRLAGLEAPELGLSGEDAAARRERYGDNHIVETLEAGWRSVLRETVKDPMLWFLLGAGGLFAVAGEITEAVVLLAALIPLVGMDAFLHRRAQASTEGLGSRLASTARVLRDGQAQTVPAAAVVPGDVVIVEASEAFPADGIIVDAERTQVDESSLTGESQPVRKDALAPLPGGGGERPIDGVHWGFAGTRVLAGRARMIVGYTGGETLYGEIVRSATRGGQERTPLQVAVANLVKILLIITAAACVALALVRLQQGHGMTDALLSAMTLAIAALPEEFPVVLTFFLGVGVYRLAKRQALVRRAVVVENIGRVSCVCSDKTGTITEGRFQLTHRIAAAGSDEDLLLRLAAAAARRETGDPLDNSILDLAGDELRFPVLARFPFTEDRKRETVVFAEGGTTMAAVKGAPEVVLGLCGLGAGESGEWMARTAALAGEAHKVIGCAWRKVEDERWHGDEPDDGFTFAGLLAFEDPVRDGVAEALQMCQRANIHVIMVTGDHPATATAVAREIGLGSGAPQVVDAAEVEERIATEGGRFLRGIDVIARAVPAQKLGLVRALQADGEIVAVTGDGVNDVPALLAADVGIAMGERGTRSAREISSIVLLDDNLRSIVRAIAEGRQLFSNLQLSFQYLLMIHMPLVVTAAIIPLAGYPLLYLPVHIVWLELIIHPSALLVFQELPPGENIASRRRSREVRFFDGRQWLVIVLVGMFITAMVTVAYGHGLGMGMDVEYARSMALAALTLASAAITAALSRLRGLTAKLIVALTIALTVLLVQFPLLAAPLHLQPLALSDWAVAASAALAAALIPFFGRSVPGGQDC
ncbi:MAG TPA: cation-transporting P-type ATPase [Xanthomonadales bacterium]|nr:cation-transporting P-type ATPase [Xanthomonadales bacterium]